jgi:hypothetical protein
MTPTDIEPKSADISGYPSPKLAGLSGALINIAPILLPTGLPDGRFAPEETEISLEHFRLPSLDPQDLADRSFSAAELTRDTRHEGSVYLQGEHHWVILHRLSFGKRTKTGIIAHYELEFDLYFCEPERFTKTLTVDTTLQHRRRK